MSSTVLPLLLFAATLCAQAPSLELPGGRRLLLLDAGKLLAPDGPDLVLKLQGEDLPPPPPSPLAGVADFIRHFASPAFGPGDDVQPLSRRYLAVLASPEKCAAVEQMVRTAIARSDEQLVLEVQLMQLPGAVYAKVVAPLFPADATPQQRQCLLVSGDTSPLLAAVAKEEVERLSAPKLCVRPLRSASLGTAKHIDYVRDYTVLRSGDKAVANPVVAHAKDGIDVELMATFVDHGNVAVACKVEVNTVELPLLESTVDLGTGAPVKVQLPRVTTIRLSQQAELPLGQSLLLSAKRPDGSWLCALVRVSLAK